MSKYLHLGIETSTCHWQRGEFLLYESVYTRIHNLRNEYIHGCIHCKYTCPHMHASMLVKNIQNQRLRATYPIECTYMQTFR